MNTFIHHIGGHLRWDGATWGLVLKRSLNFSKIKKLVINLQHLPKWNPPRDYETARRKKVARLARALFGIPALQIEVQNWRKFRVKYKIIRGLEPLAILRKVQRIQLQGVFENPRLSEHNIILHELIPLVMGDSATESSFKRYGNLKAYALSFERHYKRRLFMDSEAILLRGWPDWNDHSTFFNLAAISQLKLAGIAGAKEDRISFRFRRMFALLSLENQYLQIKIEKQILFNSINLRQRDLGTTRAQELCRYHFEDTDPANSPVVGFKAFLALCFCAVANDHIYDDMDREIAMTKLYNAAAHEGNLSMTQRLARKMAHKSDNLYDWTICSRYFKSALKDMLAQHDDILRKRSHIFKDDIVVDNSYNVSSWEFEDSADTVYRDDDRDKPVDIEAQELLFGIPNQLPTLAHPTLERAHLLASQEPPRPLIDVGPSKGVFHRPLSRFPIMSLPITIFERAVTREGHARRPAGRDPCAYRDPTWPDSDSLYPWNMDMPQPTRRRSV